MKNHLFSDYVCQQLGIYVYRLVDPRNAETFYIGKGQGNRVFQHGKAAREFVSSAEDGVIPLKIERIRAIQSAGLEVQHIIHRHGIETGAIATQIEAAVIDAYPGLSNVQGGHGSGDFGSMHTSQIVRLYEMEEVSPNLSEKLLLINVNRSSDELDREDFYFRVRFAWRISKQKAEQADYICAVVRGVIMGVYIADAWLPATSEEFGEFAHIMDVPAAATRHGFIGREAPDEVQERFRNKRLPTEMRHVQNPIRYWNI